MMGGREWGMHNVVRCIIIIVVIIIIKGWGDQEHLHPGKNHHHGSIIIINQQQALQHSELYFCLGILKVRTEQGVCFRVVRISRYP